MLAEHADLRQGSVACWVALARCPVWPVFDFVVTSKVPQLPCALRHALTPLVQMIEDTQLMVFVNVLGVTIFGLIVAYHYVAAGSPANR